MLTEWKIKKLVTYKTISLCRQ